MECVCMYALAYYFVLFFGAERQMRQFSFDFNFRLMNFRSISSFNYSFYIAQKLV